MRLTGAAADLPLGLPAGTGAAIRVDPSVSAELSLPTTVDGHLRKLDSGELRLTGPVKVGQAVLADSGSLSSGWGVVGSAAGTAGGMTIDGAQWQVGGFLLAGAAGRGRSRSRMAARSPPARICRSAPRPAPPARSR
ncbi:hypothetical protein WBO78_24835 [Bosea sp. CCNWLW174]|uniref:hypothetical protein n=1 Tax=unclassified Bosea (in: a-proteobacteria) TaxID=2653178 RepID=UPI0030144886